MGWDGREVDAVGVQEFALSKSGKEAERARERGRRVQRVISFLSRFSEIRAKKGVTVYIKNFVEGKAKKLRTRERAGTRGRRQVQGDGWMALLLRKL